MSASNFRTENNTYRKLIGNGLVYRIPRFQRDYSWGEQEWEDLWLDIQNILGQHGEAAHYMGYLVLQSQDDKQFDVIDGQQRLTTLALIVLAVLRQLQRLVDGGQQVEQNRQRISQIRQTYIGYLDPVTLVSRSKLTLNRNNDDYFQTYLVPLAHLPQRGIRASEHSLRKAFEWFDRHVGDYLGQADGEAGVVLARLLEDISDKLFFTVISVTDELNAYKVFETLNARGVRLSSTDLLKNYLFSVLDRSGQHQHELHSLELRWEAMLNRLGNDSFPDFLRTHWLSRHGFVRHADLFKTIRAAVADREAVFGLLRNMEQDLDTYLALISAETSGWPVEWRTDVQILKMFRVRQPFSCLLAAKRCLDDAGFALLLKSCVVISFRYNIIGSLPTNEQERVYHALAQQLAAGKIDSASAALQVLRPIYPPDAAFLAAFADKVIGTRDARSNRIVRYVLCQLERQAGGSDWEFDSDGFNIEHVLPQNPASGWDAFSDAEIEALTYRIGNMALLERGANRQIGNQSYADKRPVLAGSKFVLTQKLSDDNADWTPKTIAARQRALAKAATAVWRIAQLS